MNVVEVSPQAFALLQELFREESGIALTTEKRMLVQTRLGRRVAALDFHSFDQYCRYLQQPENAVERRLAVDLLTTNETYFFREPRHFEVLAREAVTRFAGRALRVWSAACSSGEEAYSIAMTLLEKRPDHTW